MPGAALGRGGAARRPDLEAHFADSRGAGLCDHSAFAGWFQFQPLYARIVKEQPDLLEYARRLR